MAGWLQTAVGIGSTILLLGIAWGVNRTVVSRHEKQITALEAAREIDRRDRQQERDKLNDALDQLKTVVNALNVSIARLQGRDDDHR